MINIAEISQNESWRPTVPASLPGSWQLLIQSGARVSEFIQHILKTQKKAHFKGFIPQQFKQGNKEYRELNPNADYRGRASAVHWFIHTKNRYKAREGEAWGKGLNPG